MASGGKGKGGGAPAKAGCAPGGSDDSGKGKGSGGCAPDGSGQGKGSGPPGGCAPRATAKRVAIVVNTRALYLGHPDKAM